MNKAYTFWTFILSLVVLWLLSLSCSTAPRVNLETENWLRVHSPIMQQPTPWFDLPEYQYFLKLSPKMQGEYIRVFWQLRMPGMEGEFYERLGYVRSNLTGDMARVYLICGKPELVHRQGDKEIWTYDWNGGKFYAVFRGIYLVFDDEITRLQFWQLYQTWATLFAVHDCAAWDKVLEANKPAPPKPKEAKK